MWCYRKLLRVPWTENKINNWILQQLNVDKELLDKVKFLKLDYFYRHMTKGCNCLEKNMLHQEIEVVIDRDDDGQKTSANGPSFTSMKEQEGQQKTEVYG